MSKDNEIKNEITKWCQERNVECEWIEKELGCYLKLRKGNQVRDYFIGNKDAVQALSFKTMDVILSSLLWEMNRDNDEEKLNSYLIKFANQHYGGNIKLAEESKIYQEYKKFILGV